jgi:hypothetical protein
MAKTATALGTSLPLIRRMSATQQLSLVRRYLSDTRAAFAPGQPLATLQSVAMAVFYPRYMFVDPSTPFPPNVQAWNPGIRTPADYLAHVLRVSGRVRAMPHANEVPTPKTVDAPVKPDLGEIDAAEPPGMLERAQEAATDMRDAAYERYERAQAWWAGDEVPNGAEVDLPEP